jgi:hypothetical protein
MGVLIIVIGLAAVAAVRLLQRQFEEW